MFSTYFPLYAQCLVSFSCRFSSFHIYFFYLQLYIKYLCINIYSISPEFSSLFSHEIKLPERDRDLESPMKQASQVQKQVYYNQTSNVIYTKLLINGLNIFCMLPIITKYQQIRISRTYIWVTKM